MSILNKIKEEFSNDGTSTGCEVSVPSNKPKCGYQVLSTDNQTTISISDGNSIELSEIVKFTETDTYLVDVTLTGTILSIKYKGEDGVNQIKSVDLSSIAGGGVSAITVSDTNTVLLTLAANVLSANIQIDPASTTNITVSSNGLKIDAPPETSITANDSSTIDFTTSGTGNHTITADLKISTDPGNIATVDSEGLLVLASSIPVSETPNTSTDTNSINMILSGVSGRNIQADLNISGDSGNLAEIRATGLYVGNNVNYKIQDMFKVGDVGKPDDGDITYVNSALIGKTKLDVNVEIQGISLPYNDANQRSFTLDAEPSITGTILLNAQFDANENVRIYW